MSLNFYINKGRRCAQTAIKSAVIGDTLSYKELDILTGRKSNQITTPIQIAYALQKLNIDFIYPIKSFFLDKDIKKLKIVSLNEFGKEVMQKTNFGFIEEIWGELINSKNYLLNEKPTLGKISDYIKVEKTPVCLINYDIYVGREDKKRGHYLIIHEINNNFVRVMDSGPQKANPNKKISKKRLEDSLMETPLDYGIILI